MIEIRPTGWLGLIDRTWLGLVWPGLPSNKICTALWHPALHFAIFITIYHVQIKCFLNKLIVPSIVQWIWGESGGDSASLRFGAAKIDSRVSKFFETAKWVILDDYAIFYKDWSGTSPDQTGPPELVMSSHWHQTWLRSPVLPLRLDRSDY